MNWDINIVAGLVAGVAAMVPGAVIYDPRVLGKRWMKEIGTSPEKQKAEGASPAKAVGQMFVVSLINGLIASVAVSLAGAATVKEAFDVVMILTWFWLSANLMLVFFEGRSWAWFRITALAHIVTGAVIGVVLGLML